MAKKTKAKAGEKPDLLEELFKESKILNKKDTSVIETNEIRCDYTVPFNHLGLQKITGGLISGGALLIEGDSQCLAGGTLVATINGPKPIELIEVGDEVFGFNKDGSISPTKVLKTFKNGVKEVFRLDNRGRIDVYATLDHRWGTSCVQGDYEKITFGEHTLGRLAESRRLFINRRFVEYDFKGESFKYAYALGALLGDGCCRQGNRNIHISSRDLKIPEKVRGIIGAKYVYTHNEETYTYVISNGPMGENYNEKVTFPYYSEYLEGKYAHEKTIPQEIVDGWDRDSLLEFLAGLIDTDGSVFVSGETQLSIYFTTTSEKLGDLYSYLIYKIFQIKPSKYEDSREGKRRVCFSYRISENNSSKRVLHAISDRLVCDWKKFKPMYGDFPEQISDYVGVKLGDSKFCETYDIHVDNATNLYVLHDNGLVTHNSGKSWLVYELLANAVKMGGYCYLEDAERAFQNAYLYSCGLPTDSRQVVTSQLVSVEKSFQRQTEFVMKLRDKLKDPKIPIVTAIDSFVPMRCDEQLENDLKDKDTGYGWMKRANAFYECMYKYLQVLSDYSASFVLINQLRQDKSIMFGDQNKTQGDNLKYIFNQRVRGTLAGQDKDENDKKIKLAQKVRWVTLKNRFIRPLQEVTLTYKFDGGMVKSSGLYDLLVRDRLIIPKEQKDPDDGRKKIKGCVVVADETRKFYPLTEARNMLADFPELLDPKFVSGEYKDEDVNIAEDSSEESND